MPDDGFSYSSKMKTGYAAKIFSQRPIKGLEKCLNEESRGTIRTTAYQSSS